MTIVALLSIAAIIGIVLTTIELVAVVILRRSSRPFSSGPRERARDESSFPLADSIPDVSILKPLCGLDDELEANLESFARIEGVRHEVIVSVADPNDPALAVVARVQARYPEAPIRLVAGGAFAPEPKNRKVERLLVAATEARGAILFISDSNVRIGPNDIADTIAMFSDPKVGCVSNVFRGDGAHSLGARLEALHLLTFVAPGAALASLAGIPCVIGKSMAVRRSALESIGGFERFIRIFAEDQAIAIAVRRAGWRVVLSPVVVRNVVVLRSVRAALARQVRWNRIRYSFSRFEYMAEFLVNPMPLALLASIAAKFLAPDLVSEAIAIAAATLLVRIGQGMTIADLLGYPRRRDALLVPFQDLLQFGAQFAPLMSNRVEWRGAEVRLGRGTELRGRSRHPERSEGSANRPSAQFLSRDLSLEAQSAAKEAVRWPFADSSLRSE